MKWKLYQLCCLYNMIIVSAYTCSVFYIVLQEHFNGTEDFFTFLIFLVAVLIFFIKNYMGNILFNKIKSHASHRNRFGLSFYFLWFISLAATVGFVFLVYDLVKSEDFINLFTRSIRDMFIILSMYITI